MPKGVDERVWKRAKAAAAESGESDNHAYVMAIYRRMMGILEKARRGERVAGAKYISRRPDGKGGWHYTYEKPVDQKPVASHDITSVRKEHGPPTPLRDEDRGPLKVYQGNNASRIHDADKGSEAGIYLTPRRRYAARYGTRVHETYVALSNPLVVENKGEISPRDLTHGDIRDLISRGYDGIVVKNPGSMDAKASEVVVFSRDSLISSVDDWMSARDQREDWEYQNMKKARKGERVAGSKYISRRPDGKGGWIYRYPDSKRYRVTNTAGRVYTTGQAGDGQAQLPYKESPDRVGPVHANMELPQVEDLIKSEEREHVIAFVTGAGDTLLPEGQVFRKRGSSDTVVIPANVGDAWREHGEVMVTHNHPNGSPLSSEDIMLAVGCDLAEIRAVTPSGGVWSMRRPQQGWGHKDGVTAEQVKDMLQDARRQTSILAGIRMDKVITAAGGDPVQGAKAKGYDDEAWNEIWSKTWNEQVHKAFRSGHHAPRLEWTIEYSGVEHFDWQRNRAGRQLRSDALPVSTEARKARLFVGLADVLQKASPRPPGRGWQRIPKPRGGRLGWRRPDGKGGFTYMYDDQLTGQLGLFSQASTQPGLFSQVKRKVASALPTVLKAPISKVIEVAKRASAGKRYTSVVEYDKDKPWTDPDWSPDLSSYDHILVNTSAGKDSQAMLDYMVQLADKQGVDRSKLVAIHADLGQVEWERTKELAKQQADAYGVRFAWVQRESGDLLDQVRDRYHRLHQRLADADALRAAGVETFEALAKLDRADVIEIIGEQDEKWTRAFDAPKRAQQLLTGARKKSGPIDFGTPIPWPSSQARYCTSDQKTSQIKKWINANTGQNGRDRVLNCLGIRAGESPARAKKPGWVEGKTDTSKRQVDQWYPIFGWSERRVWDTIAESGVPYHTAYNKGMGRLSCVFCVFAPKASLVTAAMNNPELFEKYLALEREVGYQFSSNTSLEDVAKAVEERRAELAATNGVLPVRSTEDIVGGASLTKALESVVDLAPISTALVQGLTALRGQASVVVQWRDNGCCVHLRSGDDDYHLAWYEGPQANAASVLAMAMAGDWGVPFEEHGQVPPVDEDPIEKASPRPPGRGWQRIPKPRGGRLGWRRPDGKGSYTYMYDDQLTGQPGLFSKPEKKPAKPLPDSKIPELTEELRDHVLFRRLKTHARSTIKRAAYKIVRTQLLLLQVRDKRSLTLFQESFVDDAVSRLDGPPGVTRSIAEAVYQTWVKEASELIKEAVLLGYKREDILDHAPLQEHMSDATLDSIAREYGDFHIEDFNQGIESSIAGEVGLRVDSLLTNMGIDTVLFFNRIDSQNIDIVDASKREDERYLRIIRELDTYPHIRELVHERILAVVQEVEAEFSGGEDALKEAMEDVFLPSFKSAMRKLLELAPYSGMSVDLDNYLEPLDHWGSSVSSNGVAHTTAMFGDHGRFRPLDKNMQLVEPNPTEGARREGAARYLYAQKRVKETPREEWPTLYRGMGLPASVVNAMKVGDRIPATGCTSFSFDKGVAEHYASNDWTRQKSVEDARMLILEMERTDVVDSSLAGWMERKGRGRELPAYEVVSGVNAFEVLEVDRSEDVVQVKVRGVFDDE